VLLKGDYVVGLVVVRPRLVEPMQSRLPDGSTTVLRVTPGNRNDLPDLLVDMLETRLSPL
jgi:hypothetical protein